MLRTLVLSNENQTHRGQGSPHLYRGGRMSLWVMKQIPVFSRDSLFDFFEDPVKGGDAGKSSLEGHIGDGQIRVGQQVLHFFDPAGTEVIIII